MSEVGPKRCRYSDCREQNPVIENAVAQVTCPTCRTWLGLPPLLTTEDKLKQVSEAFREALAGDRPLPIPVQPLDEHGNPDGPAITTWGELHASKAFADPVRDAIAEAESAIKRAEALVRTQYLANTNGDGEALRPVLAQLIRAGFDVHKAAGEWKPHEYPRLHNPSKKDKP